jgi:pimeloyl-ACP methyl ester carboxylesterase
MPQTAPAGATIDEVTHHVAEVNGAALHYVTAGQSGTPVLLVHGFPESWWAFREVIPLLAADHQVIAVDLPGFADSAPRPDGPCTSTWVAESLRGLIEHLDRGPVHLTGQDISGPATFRLAAGQPDLVRSYAGIETGLPGFGLERLADVTHGGTWHIGVLAAPGIPAMLLAGRERVFLTDYAIPAMSADPARFTARDVDELTRVFARPDGFAGASGLYRSMLDEGEEIQQIVAEGKLTMPVLSLAAGGGLTHPTLEAVAQNATRADIPASGHFVAFEAPRALAEELLRFYRGLDA